MKTRWESKPKQAVIVQLSMLADLLGPWSVFCFVYETNTLYSFHHLDNTLMTQSFNSGTQHWFYKYWVHRQYPFRRIFLIFEHDERSFNYHASVRPSVCPSICPSVCTNFVGHNFVIKLEISNVGSIHVSLAIVYTVAAK